MEKLLEKFDISKAKVVRTSFASHFKLSLEQYPKMEDEKKWMDRVPYASIVDSLMFAMMCTRSDIAYAVGVLSQLMANFEKMHWEAVKWVLRYLKGISDYAITYSKSSSSMQDYVDANFVDDLDKRRSTIGYIFQNENSSIS